MEQGPMLEVAATHRSQALPAETAGLTGSQIKMLGIAMLGGAFEYYEFIVFGFMVPTLSQVFFSDSTERWLSILQTLAVFAVGYLVRPIGGIILSSLGDRLGRKRMFMVTLVLMATPTLFVGLLPTYAQIGAFAPLLLLVCRLCQGLAMGAEIPSALTFVVEHVPERRSGLAIGLMGSGLSAGLLLGIMVVSVVSHAFSKDEILAYAWRAPFVLGGVCGLLSVALRRFAHETPVFAEMAARKSLNKAMPLRGILTTARWELLIGLLASLIGNGIVQTAILFPTTYFQTEMHFSAATVHTAQAALIAVSIFSLPLSGWMMDRFSWTTCIAVTATVLVAALVNVYAAPTEHNILVNMALMGIPGALPIMLNNHTVGVFPAQIRITGIAAAHNIATAVAGGTLPILMGLLAHFDPRALIYVPAAFAIIALAITPVATRYRKPLAFQA
ncbi:MFS family permease [Bradyrhizobium sp. USDA 4524]|uniref:MFS transporter n=1 Tax=unclassified Bradyrhizobium TaxID=2631580 RepID=UPI00209DC46E|nr:MULTISPECIES: MFS transporter [unclassified Bradyrhizobium]MCP1845918.1 MFS family permease [Bradyrhizobium sp. USDA 4538]MCP1907448.1 MFS family permease [Bradyrhizobium sp. USDA 4537]MCP1985234.1 MFS family permease [Bradyrhizobium sp. USDA 4539]